MTGNFDVSEPKEFYADFVRRAFDEFIASPLDMYRVKTAVAQADILAERVWGHFKDSEPERIGNTINVRAYRTYLAEHECADFQLVWDVHDGHKHVNLRRDPRKVTSAAQSGLRKKEGSFDSGAFGDCFDIDVTEAVVVLDDGTERTFFEVLSNVINMWDRIINGRRGD